MINDDRCYDDHRKEGQEMEVMNDTCNINCRLKEFRIVVNNKGMLHREVQIVWI